MMNITNINVLHPIAIEEPNWLASFSVVDLASFDEAQVTDIYKHIGCHCRHHSPSRVRQ